MRRLVVLLAIVVGLGCASAPVVRTTVLSLDRIDCPACGQRLVEELERRPGVYSAKFNPKSAEVVVLASPNFDVLGDARRIAQGESNDVLVGAGRGSYVPAPSFPAGADVATIEPQGNEVPPIASFAVAGKITVVEFFASWCRSCHLVDAQLARVLVGRSDVAYRRVDVVEWDNPLAQAYLHGVGKLPFVVVFDRKGGRVAEFAGSDSAQLNAALEKAAAR